MPITAAQNEQHIGSILFSFGFGPFFLFGSIWAAFAMVLWIMAWSGLIALPTRFDPFAWHGHAFLFGYLSAIVAGFLLTAVPNWTGRSPMKGLGLAALFGLWLVGRIAVLISVYLPVLAVALIDLSFPVVLGAVILREIVAGKNWRNLVILGLLAIFALANMTFHIEAAKGLAAAQGYGIRLGVGAALMMVSVIGGRIIPSFTGSWFNRQAIAARPAPPMQVFDKITLLVTLVILGQWIALPDHGATGVGLVILGPLHTIRLVRWKGHLTTSEPLVYVLHVAYSFVPLGAVFVGMAILAPVFIDQGTAQHIWMGGALGLMTLAVMTRASLGHTGRPLHAGPATKAIYLALCAAIVFRLAAGFWPHMVLYQLSALCWILAFGGFVVAYGSALLTPREDGTP